VLRAGAWTLRHRCNRVLTAMDLRENGITFTGAQALCTAVNPSVALETLAVFSAALPVGGVLKNTAKELQLRRCALQPGDASLLAAALRTNTSVRTVDLSDNALCGMNAYGAGRFQPDGFLQLAAALATGPQLTELDLGGNKLCGVHVSVGSVQVGTGQQTDSPLVVASPTRSVSLTAHARMGRHRTQGTLQTHTLTALCEAVVAYPALTSLSLAANDILDAGASVVSDALAASPHTLTALRQCNLDYNSLTVVPPFLVKVRAQPVGGVAPHLTRPACDQSASSIHLACARGNIGAHDVRRSSSEAHATSSFQVLPIFMGLLLRGCRAPLRWTRSGWWQATRWWVCRRRCSRRTIIC